jgi:hypothetical protein
VDRPAVYVRTGFPENDPTYDRLKAYLQEHTELKMGWSGKQFESQYAVDVHAEPRSEDFARRIEVLHTPRGDLRRSVLVSLKGQPSLHETFLINSPEDAETYLSLPMPEIRGDATSFPAAQAEVGEKGIVDVDIGFNPAGFVAELCGSANFALMSVTHRDVLHALCERQMRIALQRVTFLLSQNVGPFFAMAGEEYIVPPLHGPKDFYEFNVKYDKPIIDLVHEGAGRVHIHCHGSMKNVFGGFLDMRTDVLHPFEAPPLGDILPRDAKELARGKLCLEGNIQIHRMYEATPQQIREETAHLMEDTFDDHRGLIVCPTASPYIRGEGESCFPQFKAMIDAVLGWGT